MELPESIKVLKAVSNEVWQRDKAVFAQKVAPILPDIIETLTGFANEIEMLRKENSLLRADLSSANRRIDQINSDADVIRLRNELFYLSRARLATLNRIADVFETLK